MEPSFSNHNNPFLFVPWWLDIQAEVSTLMVLAWSDEVARKTTLKAFARRHDAMFLTVPECRSNKQFLSFVAHGCRLAIPSATIDRLFEALQSWILSNNVVLVLDEAERLTPSNLRIVRDLYKRTEHALVLSTGTAALAKRIDRVDRRCRFWQLTAWWHVDVPHSKTQLAHIKALNELRPPRE